METKIIKILVEYNRMVKLIIEFKNGINHCKNICKQGLKCLIFLSILSIIQDNLIIFSLIKKIRSLGIENYRNKKIKTKYKIISKLKKKTN